MNPTALHTGNHNTYSDPRRTWMRCSRRPLRIIIESRTTTADTGWDTPALNHLLLSFAWLEPNLGETTIEWVTQLLTRHLNNDLSRDSMGSALLRQLVCPPRTPRSTSLVSRPRSRGFWRDPRRRWRQCVLKPLRCIISIGSSNNTSDCNPLLGRWGEGGQTWIIKRVGPTICSPRAHSIAAQWNVQLSSGVVCLPLGPPTITSTHYCTSGHYSHDRHLPTVPCTRSVVRG